MKKILLGILSIVVIFGVVSIIPLYMEKKEDEKRQETALSIIETLNDPYLTAEERDAQLQEIYGISSGETVSNGTVNYTLNGNSDDAIIKELKKEYNSIKNVLKKNDFTIKKTSEDFVNNDGKSFSVDSNKDSDIEFMYLSAVTNKKIEFKFFYYDINELNISENKVFKEILEIAKIETIDNDIEYIDDYIKDLYKLNSELNDEWILTMKKEDETNIEYFDIETYDVISPGDEDYPESDPTIKNNRIVLTFEKYL